ncbi:MAG: hypothetical protein WCE38_03835 [Burkholderiales bacterium]
MRYALRTLRRRPGFAAVALLTLALGSGATTVIFTVMHGVLFKPVPFADPATLVKVDEQTKGIVDYRWAIAGRSPIPTFSIASAKSARSTWRPSATAEGPSAEPVIRSSSTRCRCRPT